MWEVLTPDGVFVWTPEGWDGSETVADAVQQYFEDSDGVVSLNPMTSAEAHMDSELGVLIALIQIYGVEALHGTAPVAEVASTFSEDKLTGVITKV